MKYEIKKYGEWFELSGTEVESIDDFYKLFALAIICGNATLKRIALIV